MEKRMYRPTIEKITPEKFQEIYTDEKFRNGVKNAGKNYDIHGKFKYYLTCSYPVRYIVTQEQVKEAQEELTRAKEKKLSELQKGTLLFIGMGSTYKEKYPDDACNYRIRSYFKNTQGRYFLVEFSKSNDELFYCSECDDLDLEKENKERPSGKIDTYKQRIMNQYIPEQFTTQNVLKFVNRAFDCTYTSVEVDNTTLWCGDYISEC